MISIEFFGAQRIITKTGKIQVPLDGMKSAQDAFNFVRNKYPQLPIDDGAVLITINHVAVPLDRLLKPNDSICFIPGIGGG